MTIAVLVPVMRRPHHAAPFMASLKASGADATVYAIADANDPDTIDAWFTAGASVLVTDTDHRFAPKVNYGYRHTTEPWMLVVGDDVRFHRNWDREALKAAGDLHHLVATNDLGNYWVMSGVHATHPLVRREWVDRCGASWDGPGVVAHEGYGHAFCDNEWSLKARVEGVFVYAADAIIEHLHPTWGKGEMDDVYTIGMQALGADGVLFSERRERYAKGAT